MPSPSHRWNNRRTEVVVSADVCLLVEPMPCQQCRDAEACWSTQPVSSSRSRLWQHECARNSWKIQPLHFIRDVESCRSRCVQRSARLLPITAFLAISFVHSHTRIATHPVTCDLGKCAGKEACSHGNREKQRVNRISGTSNAMFSQDKNNNLGPNPHRRGRYKPHPTPRPCHRLASVFMERAPYGNRLQSLSPTSSWAGLESSPYCQ